MERDLDVRENEPPALLRRRNRRRMFCQRGRRRPRCRFDLVRQLRGVGGKVL